MHDAADAVRSVPSRDHSATCSHELFAAAAKRAALLGLLLGFATAPNVVRAGDIDFAVPLSVLGAKDLVAAPSITPGDILELRAGPGPDNTTFNVAALVRGPGNTTAISLLNFTRATGPQPAGTLDLNAIPITAISNVQAFSLGGGCRSGSSAIFPFIQNLSNNFRPFVLRVTGGVPSVSPLAIAGSDNIHSIECTTNGQDVYYLAANATQARVEVWRATGTNPPVSVFNNLPQLLSPFSGGVRPIMATIEASPAGAAIVIQYQRTNGQIYNSYLSLNPFNLAATCLLFTQSPVPGTFTVVREGRIMSLRSFAGVKDAAISSSDPDRNGSAELVRTPISTCAPTLANVGSSSGGNGFTWTGYGAVFNPWRGWAYIGNGNTLNRIDIDSSAVQSLTPPLLGPGGPYDFIGGTNADNKAFGILQFGTRPGLPRELRVALSVEYKGDGNFASDFEGPTLGSIWSYNQ